MRTSEIEKKIEQKKEKNMSLSPLLFKDFFNDLPEMILNELEVPSNSWSPKVDIREEEKHYVLLAEIPGVSSEDIEITFENNNLILKGEKKSSAKSEDNFHRVETRSGSFTRSFSFPQHIDSEAIKAKNTDGVLEITIPKKESSLPRKIVIA